MLIVNKQKDVLEKIERIPKIDRSDRGTIHETECLCGGTIKASRSVYNGHLTAKCDKCHFLIME